MTQLAHDLHIHSCLAPGGEDDMGPANSAGVAALKGLDGGAVTDQNGCES